MKKPLTETLLDDEAPPMTKKMTRRSSQYGADSATGNYRRNSIELALDTDMAFGPTGTLRMNTRFSESGEAMGKTTLKETTINASLTLIGCGVLGIPYAFGQAGLMSGILLLVITMVTCWTAVLIGRLMDVVKPLAEENGMSEDALDWPFIGFAAFGDSGRLFCSAVFMCELWFCMIALLVINGVNLNLIFPSYLSLSNAIILCGVVSFLFLFPSAKVLAYFSIFGILSTVLALGGLIWSAEAMGTWQDASGIEWVNLPNVPMSLGIFQFCFVAHSIFPSMHRGMEHPEKNFPTAMYRSFTFAGLFYLIVGVFAFLVYGSQAQPSFMSNLGKELDLTVIPGMSFIYIICSACFAVNLQATFPLVAMALIAAVENVIGITESSFSVRTLMKLVFMSATVAIGVALRSCMAPIQSLVGCFCATNTCLFLPMLCGLKLLPMNGASKIAVAIALIYAVYILVYGTYTNVQTIIDTMIS